MELVDATALAELRSGDELIVCDNASGDGTAALVRELAPEATVIESGGNLGFGAGCNLAAGRASNEYLLLLNPDNVVERGFRDAIELPLTEERGWSAWQGLVTDEGGATLNSLGGVVHFTGIAWAGGAARPRSLAPDGPEETPFASGACLMISHRVWVDAGGFSAPPIPLLVRALGELVVVVAERPRLDPPRRDACRGGALRDQQRAPTGGATLSVTAGDDPPHVSHALMADSS